METATLEKKLQDIKKRVEQNAKDIEAAAKRKADAVERQEKLQIQYESNRGERQLQLALGKDASQISKQVRELKDQSEIVEDEIIGLDMRLADLVGEKEALQKNLIETEVEIGRSKLRPLVAAYNEKAAELADIVESIWQLRIELNEGIQSPQAVYSTEGWDDNALSCIPKLFFHEEPIPGYHSSEGCIFKYPLFRADMARERTEKREASRAAARAAQTGKI